MKSILPLLAMSIMADPYAASRPRRTNYVELPAKVPDKLKNVPKPLSKKQKAKLKNKQPQ